MNAVDIIQAIQDIEHQHRELQTRCAAIDQELHRLQARWPIVATDYVPMLRTLLHQRVAAWLTEHPDFEPIKPAVFNAGYRALFQACQIPELKALPVSQVATATTVLEAWTPDLAALWVLLLRHTIRERLTKAIKARRITPTPSTLSHVRHHLWTLVGPLKTQPPADTLSRQRVITRLLHAPLFPAKKAARTRASQ
jgi:hypothetical protein